MTIILLLHTKGFPNLDHLALTYPFFLHTKLSSASTGPKNELNRVMGLNLTLLKYSTQKVSCMNYTTPLVICYLQEV